ETNVPSDLQDVVSVSGGAFHVLALKRDGSVATWGATNILPIPAGLSGVVAINAGQYLSMGLKSDGTFVTWGEISNPVVTQMPSGLNQVKDVQMGLTHGFALKNDGTVIGWGAMPSLQGPIPVPVPLDLNGVMAISAGENHDLIITPRPQVTGISSPVN